MSKFTGSVLSAAITIVLLLSLAGCQRPVNLQPVSLTSIMSPRPTGSANPVMSAFLAPAGDYAMVTTRVRPDVPQSGNKDIVCTAPSPDWATAVAAAQQLQASGGNSGGTSASLAASSSLSETITAMLGRTGGVVALRDGLYHACEAYANGAIGKDAYALVLSQYGNLLVSLAGGPSSGSSAAGGSGTGTATPAGVAVAVNGGSPTAPSSPSSSSTLSASPADATVAQMQQEALQGMLVTCINEFDPTVRPRPEQNPMLVAPCASLIKAVVGEASELLTPTSISKLNTKSPPVGSKPTPNAAVQQIQQKLHDKCNADIKVDGILGNQTSESLLKNAGQPCLAKS